MIGDGLRADQPGSVENFKSHYTRRPPGSFPGCSGGLAIAFEYWGVAGLDKPPHRRTLFSRRLDTRPPPLFRRPAGTVFLRA